MKIFFVSYFIAAFAMIIIDFIWLTLMMKPFYQKQIGHLMTNTPAMFPVILFYVIFILGLIVLIISPALTGNYSYLKLFLYGALFGLVAYGTYDLTNQATLKNWPAIVTIVDLIWGTLLTGTVSIITKFIIKFFS